MLSRAASTQTPLRTLVLGAAGSGGMYLSKVDKKGVRSDGATM